MTQLRHISLGFFQKGGIGVFFQEFENGLRILDLGLPIF
jgi:hypothetical protein